MKILKCSSILILLIFLYPEISLVLAAGTTILIPARPGRTEHPSALTPPTPDQNNTTSPALFQINFSSSKPVTRLLIGEYSTGEVLATWRPTGQISEPGKYYVTARNAELFILMISNSANDAQFFSVFNKYANRLRIRMDYPDMTFEEALAAPPIALYNCSLDEVESCTQGAMVPDTYQNCSYPLSGFAEIIITAPGGPWDIFKKKCFSPSSKCSGVESHGCLCLSVPERRQRLLCRGQDINRQCPNVISQKLQGTPSILTSNGRQLNIYYR